jgi:hypothetical protein
MKNTAFEELRGTAYYERQPPFQAECGAFSPCEREHRRNLLRTPGGVEHHHMHERLRFRDE